MSKSMPIVKHFGIELDKSQRTVYKAGEPVNGKCHLNIEGTVQLKNLDINLICEGYVDCKHTNSELDKKTTTIFIEKYDLLKRSATDQTLEGLIVIDFCFTIPQKSLPSSFSGKFGFIRYKIEAILHKDWDLFRKEVILTVTAPYNGRQTQELKPIVRMNQMKCGFFKDFIDLYAELDKGWITPGDKVSVYCNVDNRTDHKLRLSLSLHQQQNYLTTKVNYKLSNDDPLDVVDANSLGYSKRVLLSIPSNIKTMSLESHILKISYLIRVTIDVLDAKESSLKVELPVILTTTLANKTNTIRKDLQSLPPSYSDCQIFHKFASQDIYFPAAFEQQIMALKANNNLQEFVENKSPIFVDLPPSYNEAVFGFHLDDQ